MTYQERIDMVREAQEKILDAIELIKGAVEGTRQERNTDAHVIAHLSILVGEGHGYLSRDKNLDKVIEELEEEASEENEEEGELDE